MFQIRPALLITPSTSSHPTHPPSPAPLPLFPPSDNPDSGKRPVITPNVSLPTIATMADVLPSINRKMEERYRPAYELADGNLEREGRALGKPVGKAVMQ